MEKEFFVAAIEHPEFGEVYRFFEVDPATGKSRRSIRSIAGW